MAIQDEIPKSRLTLRYKTQVEGQTEDKTLPLRLLVTGDFSQGTSKDRKDDLDERRIRNMDGTNTDAVMKDMGMSLNFAVKNTIDPGEEEEMQVNLSIDSMKSFSPSNIVQQVPKLKGLVMLKTLMEETVSNVDNRKEFRNLLNDLFGDNDALAKMKEELKAFEDYKIPGSEKPETE